MPKGNATKQAVQLQLIKGVLRQGYRGLMSSSLVECNVATAVARLKAGGKVFLEARGDNLKNVEKLLGEETNVSVE